MRIALVARELCSLPFSGISRATTELAHGLHDAGHEVHVLAELTGEPEDLPTGAVVHDVGGGSMVEWAVALHAALVRLGVDVASVPLWGAPGVVAVQDPSFPTVVTCMTSAATLAEIDPAWALSDAARESLRLERLCMAGARHLHGLTHAALEKTRADHPGDTLTARVVARGLRDRAIPPPPRGDGPVEVLFVGRPDPRKGLDVLRRAMRGLDGARLTLAGVEEPIAQDGLDELFARADIVCQPSRYESHGVVLVEAMMFGKPIVTTTGGGIPEVVEEGGNALLTAPGDEEQLAVHLRTLAADRALRERFGIRSRELFERRYEIGVVAREMIALFEEAIRAHARSPRPDTVATLLTDALARAIAQQAIVNGKLWRVTNSRTWRYTEPLRSVARAARGERDGAP